MSKPPIGVPRKHEGVTIPVLYPGEEAHSSAVKVEVGTGRIFACEWEVGPAPGLYARWLRVKYRFTEFVNRYWRASDAADRPEPDGGEERE